MQDLKALNLKAYKWLANIPPHHWARSHFTGRAHTDMLLNNLCEVLNRQLVDGRDKAIITCLEYIREYLMKRIVIVQKVIDKSDGPFTPTVKKLFRAIKMEANQCVVVWNGGIQYQVNGLGLDQHVVDVNLRTCTCRRWELSGMPCKHTMATMWNMTINGADVGMPESWVHPSYWLDTWKRQYSYKINPVRGKLMWPKSRCPTTLLPPEHHVHVRKPKKKRRRSADEDIDIVNEGKLSRAFRTLTCGRCDNPGHNQRRCKSTG